MKLSEKEFSLSSIGEDKYLINLPHISVELDTGELKGIAAIFRILTYDELRAIDRMLPTAEDPRPNAAAITADIEEDIFKKCMFRIFGIESIEDIELDELEAGIISSLAGIILSKSYAHVENVQKFIADYSMAVNPIDQMKLMVCRFYSTPYDQVCEMSIDTLFRKYAVINATFPKEALQFNNEDNNNISDDD